MSESRNIISLDHEALVRTLQACVDEVFTTMVLSFNGAAFTPLEGISPNTAHSIQYRGDDGLPASGATYKRVVVEFSGDAAGHVVLCCTLESADSITRGLLMMDGGEEYDLSVVHDALGECANMLAGALKTKALDPIGTFTLGLPRFMEPPSVPSEEYALVYRVAAGVISVEVWLTPLPTGSVDSGSAQ